MMPLSLAEKIQEFCGAAISKKRNISLSGGSINFQTHSRYGGDIPKHLLTIVKKRTKAFCIYASYANAFTQWVKVNESETAAEDYFRNLPRLRFIYVLSSVVSTTMPLTIKLIPISMKYKQISRPEDTAISCGCRKE